MNTNIETAISSKDPAKSSIEETDSEVELSKSQKDGLLRWVDTTSPLIIDAPANDKREMLVDSIIKTVNSVSGLLPSSAPKVHFNIQGNFSTLFYYWSESTKLFRGLLLNVLGRTAPIQYVIADFGDGDFKSEIADIAFAKFVLDQEITVGESGEIFSLDAKKKLFVIVLIDQSSDRINEKSLSFKTLMSDGFFLSK